MKQRPQPLPDQDAKARLEALAQALASLKTADEVSAFLWDLCTPSELESMIDRWRVVPLLAQGIPYREIHEMTRVSVTTIGRVARTLENGTGGYATALGRQRRRSVTAKESNR